MKRLRFRGIAVLAALALSVLALPVERFQTQADDEPGKPKGPTANPAGRLKVAAGFQVDLLYSVPKEEQGSWVSMAVDPEGRLIVSDQYGKLYRVTLPPLDDPKAEVQIEPIPVEIGEAQGLLWAFDSLYVVVNTGGTFESGLYRVRDTDGDGMLDSVELLRKLQGKGEHGPHAIILSPDGESLHLVHGNATRLTEIEKSRVPLIWGEDHLLPSMPDARGHMAGVLAPGGCIYKLDPDGENWELLSMGYRNPYDIAFNNRGNLFTFDADMEWDFNTPWYRPTRVCFVASGTDFGWRNGAGKWPAHYPDSLPAVVDIGPGSPTGIVFGYGSKFPEKYQDALYICDWSYGKLYAVHLEPNGAGYSGEFEEFITGTPLPLTDIVVNPIDGALYFAVGGRRTQSGLYRVTYTGEESTEPVAKEVPLEDLAKQRVKLESFHGRPDAQAIEAAWPFLGHADRFIRHAARVAIEHQDADSWRDLALKEEDPQAAIQALLALARVSGTDPLHRKEDTPEPDPALRAKILEALGRIDWEPLSNSQRVDLLRTYAVTLNRLGKLEDEGKISKLVERFNSQYPARTREVNIELAQLLIFLEAPEAASKTVALLQKALTQEEQLDYAKALRHLKTGWNDDLRREYFSWFNRAANYRGGASFGGFVANIKEAAVANLNDEETAKLADILSARPEEIAEIEAAPPRPFVKQWTMEELVPVVEGDLGRRDYDQGRSLFAAANCFSCHRFAGEGGAFGPDLSGVSGRFSPRDLLESIIEPSKTISDQYEAVMIATEDGRVVTGRIINLHGDNYQVNTDMLNPNAMTSVNVNQIEEMLPSPVSMMPEGLLDTLDREEVLDLMAYLLSGGDPDHDLYRPSKTGAEDTETR